MQATLRGPPDQRFLFILRVPRIGKDNPPDGGSASESGGWTELTGSPRVRAEGRHMDPETMETRLVLDEAFENIVVLEPSEREDDWLPGEFDIT
jgi:hypothetical protein